MIRSVDAVYKDGQVWPLEPLDLPDETPAKIVIGDIEAESEGRCRDPLATIWEIADEVGIPLTQPTTIACGCWVRDGFPQTAGERLKSAVAPCEAKSTH